MKNLSSRICLTLSISLGAISFSQAQGVPYNFESVVISIKGSSSLHDWAAKCGEIVDYPEQITLDPANSGTIPSFGFKVAVASMDGGRGASMNNKIYKALHSKEHPYVNFTQNEPATYQVDATGKLNLNSIGTVEIAGQSRSVSVKVTGTPDGDLLILSGSHPMKLSEFNIEAPSAMFGQIQTKDDIFVHFEFTYKKAS